MTYAPRYYGIRKKEQLEEIVREKLMMAGLYEEVKGELSKSALKLSGRGRSSGFVSPER